MTDAPEEPGRGGRRNKAWFILGLALLVVGGAVAAISGSLADAKSPNIGGGFPIVLGIIAASLGCYILLQLRKQ